MGTKKQTIWWVIGITIVVVFLILIAVFTFGLVRPKNIPVLPSSLSEDDERARERNKRYKKLLEKQISLKKNLDRKFKYIYFSIRLILIGIWVGLMLVFFYTGYFNDLEGFLNFSEASLLIILVLNFLAFGRLSSLRYFIELIRLKVENFVFGKYSDLDARIEATREHLDV